MLLFASANLWAYSLATFDGDRLVDLGDLGLAPLLPWTFYGAVLLLLVGFVLVVRKRNPSVPLVLSHFGLLIAIWHATPAVLYGLPRYPFTYKHIGIAAHIQQYGSIDPNIDAYFNWPAFFALSAYLSELTGADLLMTFATWGPVVMNLLVVAALVVLLRAFTDDLRVVWVGIWFFLLSNFVGQDYFAPQSFSYALHLAILGIYVGYFTRKAARGRISTESTETAAISAAPAAEETRAAAPAAVVTGATAAASDAAGAHRRSGWIRAGALLILLVLFATVVASHQLTPFMTLASIAALVVFGLGRARLALVIMASMLGAWFTYMAHAYFAGHLHELLASVGRLATNLRVASEVITSIEGSTSGERALVLGVRQLLALLMALLGFAGWIRRLRNGWRDRVPVLLLLVPVTMVALQPYGGEIIMRIYLFAIPFLALFGAYLFLPAKEHPSIRTSVTLFLASVLMAGGMAISYYGNESINYMSAEEFDTLEHLYAVAPDGSLVVTPTSNAPTKHQRYADLDYAYLDRLLVANGLEPGSVRADQLAAMLTQDEPPAAYLLITRSQLASTQLFGVLRELDWSGLGETLARSASFDVVYQTDHGVILRAVAADAQPVHDERFAASEGGSNTTAAATLRSTRVGWTR